MLFLQLSALCLDQRFYRYSNFSSGLYDYDSATMVMPVSAAQKFLSLGDEINLIEINVDDPKLAKDNASLLQKELGPNFGVSSWLDTNQQFLKALEIERGLLCLLFFL